jgi:hypothetical protein
LGFQQTGNRKLELNNQEPGKQPGVKFSGTAQKVKRGSNSKGEDREQVKNCGNVETLWQTPGDRLDLLLKTL